MATKHAVFLAKRDRLRQIESKVRSWWEDKSVSSSQTSYKKFLTGIMSKPYWPWGFQYNSENRFKSTVNFPSPGEAVRAFSADATLFTIADHSADSVDPRNLTKTLSSVVMQLTQEIEWVEEVLAADQSSFRTGSPSSFPDRAFENQMNLAVKITKIHFHKPSFCYLQNARDLYSFSCGSGGGGMNHELVWRYMDVQTRLMTPICPHYADYVWRELLKKDGPVMKAGFPAAPSPDMNLHAANEYLHDVIIMINRKASRDKKITEENKKATSCLIYVKEQDYEERQELLRMVQSKRDNKSCTFGDLEEFYMASPSWESKVIEGNIDLIKRLTGLEDVQALSATDLDALAKAGPLFSKLYEKPPFPGHPTVILLTR
ncbi:leucine--tRNA ligase cytoplasmic [Tripterygium wilfordii]|uniref:Leucine--tRNA ligase cytoplasmic n=1 Tax=Tripterygium wilfordii TaxID=458696 RepID=A0A7J7DAM3_TRIWF|nr:leucine--tRNA ligase, cytoplasmic-like [Tripterygium wilfordii]KAF5743308.1 leucine--tRNA ligase cytoplasmic [Tripterygium wilfordii]